VPVALKPSAAVEARVLRLLRMLAALEEAIIRVEAPGDSDRDRLVERLRVLQDDIATALGLEDPDLRRRPRRRTSR
jgi:hypothetical protein